jgi:hypothetical protein
MRRMQQSKRMVTEYISPETVDREHFSSAEHLTKAIFDRP